MYETVLLKNIHGQYLIDWDVYTLCESPYETMIGNWAHNSSNLGFEERQDILRVRSNGSFKTLIIPWNKGLKPEGLSVGQVGSEIIVSTNDSETIIGDDYYAFSDFVQDKTSLTTFNDINITKNDITAEGGPIEIIIENNQATITAHGNSGVRRIRLPGSGWFTFRR